MADYAEQISLSDVKLGDRWVGISEILPTINDETPDDDLTRVVMTFRLGALTHTLDSAGTSPGITISNASTWLVTIPARDTFLPRSGVWEWEMKFYFGTSSCWTLYRGQIRVHGGVA